jgi:hypothetical protein
MATARYTTANLTQNTATEVRKLSAAMTLATGQRIAVSELIAAMVEVGKAHPDELAAALTKTAESGE